MSLHHFIAESFKIAVAVTPIVVALTTYRQFRTEKNKLKLDLYNRRFEIYTNALRLYQCLEKYHGEGDDTEFLHVQEEFIRSFRESLFLFSPESGVYKILQEMKDNLGHVKWGWQSTLHSLSEDAAFKVRERSISAMLWFNHGLTSLEARMSPCMTFHDVGWSRRVFTRLRNRVFDRTAS